MHCRRFILEPEEYHKICACTTMTSGKRKQLEKLLNRCILSRGNYCEKEMYIMQSVK